jgi:hypothetical protein
MSAGPLFKAAFPYQQDVLALSVVNLDAASLWYTNAFDLREVERGPRKSLKRLASSSVTGA